MSSILKIVRDVFSNRNVLVISVTTTVAFGIFNSLWQTWWSLYLLEALGATIPVLGLIGMIQSTSSLLFQLPGGIIADKFGRRRVIAMGTSLRLVAPITYLLARSWHWVLPGVIANAAASIYSPGFNAMIAESLPQEKRATGYGAYRMMTSIPGVFMPVISGIYMDRMGLIRGVRIGLVISVFGMVGAFIARNLFLSETLDTAKPKARSTVETVERRQRSAWGSGSTLRRLLGGPILPLLIVSCVGGFGMRMVASYMVIYGVEVVGLTKTQWGLLQTVANACSTSLILVGGMIADRYGRVPLILFARFLLPIRQMGLLFLRDFKHLLLLYVLIGIGGGLGGGGVRGGGFMGGPAWQALVADVVPSRDRGKVMGLMATITGVSGLPAPPIGGYVWERYSPNTLLIISIIFGISPIPLILKYVKEPETREK